MERSLSILLPVHNAQSTLQKSVSRVLEAASELTDRFELLIVDDGSTDHTSEIAHDLATQFPQVNVVRNSQARGLPETIRAGLEQTSGEIVCVHEGAEHVDVAALHQLWERRNDETLILARQGQATAIPPHAVIERMTGPARPAVQPRSAGFQMLRRDALESLEEQEPLARADFEYRLAPRTRPAIAAPKSQAGLLDRLKQFARGE